MIVAMIAVMGLLWLPLWLLPWDCYDCCYRLLPWTGHVGLTQKLAENVVSSIGCSNSSIS